jgi:DNA-binding transcriptional LysR family regulator
MDCLHLPVILPAKGSEVRHMIDRINTGIGATITPATETNSIYLAKRLAVDGHGIALLPALSAAVEIKAKSLVHIPLSDPGLGDLRFTVFTQRGRPLTAIAEMVLERMRDDVENYLSAL